LSLRREKAREVFLLIKRYNNSNRNEGSHADSKKSGETVVRKKAGDNWF